MAPVKGFALVTGASSGIGAVYADRLARRGYDLILVARTASSLSTLADRLRADTGRRVEALPANLVDPAEMERVELRLRNDPEITMLVNNAGVGSAASMLDSDIDALSSMVSLNVEAVMRLSYAAGQSFASRRNGTIINISSIVALQPEMLNSVYGGTKAFVLTFSQALQNELSASGVTVQAVLPGATATKFWDVAGIPLAHLPPDMVTSPEQLVDAALAGLDQGEFVTIPTLANLDQWTAYEAARRAMNFGTNVPASRYL
jgi:uncharacterized protein